MPSQEVLDHRTQFLTNLEASQSTAQPWPGPGDKPATYMDASDVQALIDKTKAEWAAADAAEAAAPPISIPGPPAAIDLLKAGDRFQKDGILFEVFETPWGNMAKRIGPVPPPAPVVPTAASVVADVVTYVRERYTLTADAEAQTELRLLLTFLAAKK